MNPDPVPGDRQEKRIWKVCERGLHGGLTSNGTCTDCERENHRPGDRLIEMVEFVPLSRALEAEGRADRAEAEVGRLREAGSARVEDFRVALVRSSQRDEDDTRFGGPFGV